MTRDEFDNQFWPYHASRFTGIAAHAKKAPSTHEYFAAWMDALGDVDLQDARDACRDIHLGDVDRPVGFDAHPMAIRDVALARADKRAYCVPTQTDNEETFACPDCLGGKGLVKCWHPKSVAAARAGRFGGRFTVYTCAVPCHCWQGDRYVKQEQRCGERDVRRYDADTFCAVPLEGDREALLEWVAAHPAAIGGGRLAPHAEFAEFGGGK